MARIYALSLKQPWAALVVSGRKTIEIRTWASRIRGRVLIHAARVSDTRPAAWKWVAEQEKSLTALTGGIVGSAEITQCLRYASAARFSQDALLHLNDPDWYQENMYGFVMRNAKPCEFRPLSGNVRFFTVEDPE